MLRPLIEDLQYKELPLQLKVHNSDKLVHIFFQILTSKATRFSSKTKKSAIQQIKFDGVPFIVNSMVESDCVHVKDWNLSQKRNGKKTKKYGKSSVIYTQ